MKRVELLSPAKVNLFLLLLGKRLDGYHEIATLMTAVDLFDTISIQFSDKDQFFCSDSLLPTDETNLAWKAVSLFRRETGIRTPVFLSLIKNIPYGMGLGGGSSNAATVLYALNLLMQVNMSTQDLILLGSHLGMDVPFFFSDGLALCTGRGENVQSLADTSRLNYLSNFLLFTNLAKKPLLSEAVYNNVSAPFSTKEDLENIMDQFLQGTPQFINDMEHPAFLCDTVFMNNYRRIIQYYNKDAVFMTGSGAGVVYFDKNEEELPKTNTLKEFSQIPLKPVQKTAENWYFSTAYSKQFL